MEAEQLAVLGGPSLKRRNWTTIVHIDGPNERIGSWPRRNTPLPSIKRTLEVHPETIQKKKNKRGEKPYQRGSHFSFAKLCGLQRHAKGDFIRGEPAFAPVV
ncbi:hypothetical protein RvY_18770 [Ramazzottius varieornatus]|uniref:Uncharacterized protein n=1 Tax=Ramazzottius varieornatus TaxID=947166 RepID=A0A1D1W713_RAMVA|nr:hypothetical protein RvY_18770 [Ramazzottius varieornatus]